MTAMPNVIAFKPLPATPSLRRPSLLISAARAGQDGWRRSRDLPRLLRSDVCPAPGSALPRLRAEESLMNTARLEGTADYDLQRHVMLMIAILAEMRAAVDLAPIAIPAAAVQAARASLRPISRETATPAHP